MVSIIVALPKLEDARHISEILKRRGMETTLICTAGARVLEKAHEVDYGVVVCGRRLKDMYYAQLAEYLPDTFSMLVLSSMELDSYFYNVKRLPLPLKSAALVRSLEEIIFQLERQLKLSKRSLKKRSEQDEKDIIDAKKCIMEKNHMTEQEAYRYIQKISMDSGTNMVETAQKILMMYVG